MSECSAPGCRRRSLRGSSGPAPRESVLVGRARALLLRRACVPWCYVGPGARHRSPVFRAGVDLVNLGVTVTDRKGNLVTDLTADDFEILEDGQTQTIRYFAAGDGERRRRRRCTSACCSTSAAAWARTWPSRKTASIKFLNTLTDAVDITVVDFDTEVRVARYSQNEFARLDRADPPAEGERRDGAVRRDRRLSGRRRRPGRPEDHAALHRRRRHAQRDAACTS